MKTRVWCRRLLSTVIVLVCSTPTAIDAAHQPPNGLTISGVVLEHDGRTAAPSMRLQLRNIDDGNIVAETVSGLDGSYSFDIGQPGVYVVEAVDDRGVRAVSKPTPAGVSGTSVNVILPSTHMALAAATAFAVVAAAAAAGTLAVGSGGAVSPER